MVNYDKQHNCSTTTIVVQLQESDQFTSITQLVEGSGLMVNVLDLRLDGLGPSSVWSHCIMTMVKTSHLHSASHLPGVWMSVRKFNAGGTLWFKLASHSGEGGREVLEILLVARVAEPGIVCIMSGSINTLAWHKLYQLLNIVLWYAGRFLVYNIPVTLFFFTSVTQIWNHNRHCMLILLTVSV